MSSPIDPRARVDALPSLPDPQAFLRHGGVMGARIAERDWSATSLGPAADWPGAIKSVLASWLDSPQAMFVAWGPDLRFFFNDTYLPFLGARGADVVGQPFQEVWPDIWNEIEPIARQALAGQGQRFEEMPLLTQRNGYPEETWWTFTYMPLRDERGRVLGMMCTASDATASVLAARKAEQHRARQNSMLQQMPGFVGLLEGPRHVYEYVNDAYRAIAGERDYLGRCIRDVLPELEGQGYFELLDQVYDSGTSFISHAMPIRFTGEDDNRHIDLLFHPLRNESGQVSGIFVGGYDVSRRVTAERALTSLNESLEKRVDERTVELMRTQEALKHSQKLEAIGKLTGGVAHDFNNLLTVIGSSVELLRRPQLAEDRRKKYVETIAETVRRAAKLTSQLLSFARRQALRPEVFDVGRQVEAISELIRPLTGPEVAIEIAASEEAWLVECDVNQFETAIVNLAVNARDAMPAGGLLTIEMSCAEGIPADGSHAFRPGPFIAVAMRDTGTGIAPEHLELVFDPFYTTKEVGKGTGLGLSQVFGFTRQSGGDVRVTSTPGQGATFTLYLPQAGPVGAGVPTAALGASALSDTLALTILVVEDNTSVGRICTEALNDLGHTTQWATDAQQALSILERGELRFDLVFSDVVMPGMNGLEMAQLIRSRHPGLPVLLASGYSDVMADVGVQGFELVQKPYSVDALVRLMRKALERPAASSIP
ncbi:hybrid sensor histidine kinase/response regulator [Variovorax saccharolyticus]|uniref:hybrid sensor histidine kinase/response regulator n=1 Tax=Variovorax saccharolyticus TaxID=3053516 RepID=UPI002577F1E9|nr:MULTISPECIES: PAS domain-containing sensor histidine kinase [unclassified Variovorax]MDM0022866.1 PAS domain-containing protein [Variovorax sp. J22R187]MDM0029684.1 PAS domain-containing protein [Variovorax sp. J31P216]